MAGRSASEDARDRAYARHPYVDRPRLTRKEKRLGERCIAPIAAQRALSVPIFDAAGR
jgi:hypothetical protein